MRSFRQSSEESFRKAEAVLPWRPSTAQALTTISCVMLLGALWIATRPYAGVFADARFYGVQAIHELNPTKFKDDLYFQFGSQDQFTFYSKLYGPLVSRLGLGLATMTFTIAGQALWLASLYYFVRVWTVERRQIYWLMAAIIALPSSYIVFLSYGESVATPRIFVEALSLVAMGLLLRRRAWFALSVLLLAAALHPLIALPALAFWFIYLALEQPLWWGAALIGLAVAGALSIAGVPPFGNLGVVYDPEWFDIVIVRDSLCFFTKWASLDYFQLCGTIALAILALITADDRERRFVLAAIVVGIGGVLCTFIGGDLIHNVFVVEVQPWRSLWLLRFVANLCALPILIRLSTRCGTASPTFIAFVPAICLFAFSRFIPSLVFIEGPAMAVAAALAVWQLKYGRNFSFLGRSVIYILIGLMCLAAILFAYAFITFIGHWPDKPWVRFYYLGIVIVTVGLLYLQSRPIGRQWISHGPWLLVLSGALCVLAMLEWDARTPWQRFLESSSPVPESLTSLLPEDASVYWEGGVEMLWLRLRRSSYFSCTQGTGALFYRNTAIEYERRRESFWPLRTFDFDKSLCPGLDETEKTTRTRDDLKGLCEREVGLDYLVLMSPVEGLKAEIWTAPVAFEDIRFVDDQFVANKTTRFYIYSCASAR